MIKESERRASQRALNMIWNAAGRYHFDPGFTAFFANGTPDDYFNLVIGLADKWLGLTRVQRILRASEHASGAEEAAELLWLGIEHYVYEKERPERPALEMLRRARAEAFFREMQTLSEQQMAMQSMTVYRQMQYRFASVSGRSLPPLSEKGRAMAEALCVPGSLAADEAEAAMLAFAGQFFRARKRAGRSGEGTFARMYRRLTSHAYRRKELLIVRPGGTERDDERAVHLSWEIRARRRTAEKAAEDLAYVREMCGPCVLPEAAMAALEKAVCTGEDRDEHLWVARPGAGEMRQRDAQMEKQRRANEKWMRGHALLMSGAVKSLAAEIELLLATFLRALPEPGRKGRLMPERAWRIGVLRDPQVFLHDDEERENPLSVHLMLDASRSRSHSQEQIAAEAAVIAESLARNHVPVSVHAFRSMRGYTVLEELKGEREDCRRICAYYAGGWNRDALMLRAAGALICGDAAGRASGSAPGRGSGAEAEGRPDGRGPASGTRHVLLVLTDASPCDTEPLAVSGRAYEGDPAVLEAADAVKDLRARGIAAAAIFHGATAHLENVYRIYGKEYVRIRSLAQLSGSVADLLQMLLQEMG